MITNISNKYNSCNLLFSIPVHENQDIINNQIENILNFNPNSKIILHVNKSFKNFDNNYTIYNNVYINSNRLDYVYGKGLLYIHINNFLEAIKLNINFNYFVIISSNEMFIKYGTNSYIDKYKNGTQIVKYDINNKWHNFHKNIQNSQKVLNLLNEIKLNTIYGGQTEGQFYEKYIFSKISNLYLKYFENNEINDFETEEIISQTIFKSFYIEYNDPITLQNYSNNINFNKNFIDNIINNTAIINNNYIENTLYSPHINNNLESIYSIKRVDRTFNNIRNLLSRKGFILNKEIFQLNTYYYSNNSTLFIEGYNHIIYKKNFKKDFHWFGFDISKGVYILKFKFKTLFKIEFNQNIGLKIHKPITTIYNYFFKNIDINIWYDIEIPLNILEDQNIIFIFDDYNNILNIEFKDIIFSNVEDNKKDNIIINLYEYEKNNIDYSIGYNNIYESIIYPLSNIYNIFIITSIKNTKYINNILNSYKPFLIINENINIYIEIIDFINKNFINISIKFLLFINFNILFNVSIKDINFYINKINFIYYEIPYINNIITNSDIFISIPYNYLNDLYDFIYSDINNIKLLYHKFKETYNYNFIIKNNYYKNIDNNLISYISNINDIKMNGFLLNHNYINNIYYKSGNSKLLINNNDEFYYYKNIGNKEWNWLGLYINDIKNILNTTIEISFYIKLLKKIDINQENYGLKTHNPLIYYNKWINECKLDIYTYINLKFNINSIDQYIILNFDNYYDEIEFYIKKFKIILNY